MPTRCCVPSCKESYDTGPAVAVFSFPKDETLASQWIRNIRRQDFSPTQHSRVCELHFNPQDVERETSYFDERTGRTLTVKLSKPRLRKEAVPALLSNMSC
ncbi:hypothetical protein Pcinc_014584 [Petrolisthes cinctipes]|uniref:THAP-type domain-containing protein n=1 Tax=Petrolisthes cinctipes TaxID=88211 RepID=A0AAE1FUQ9_PETCI|nr:hypothetical protein Pcinc_014584 [Petrolisthes cinctipes]